MSLLNIIREASIVANVAVAGEAYKYVTEQMLLDAKSGAHSAKYSVEDYPMIERTNTVLALQMQGFNCDFQDESRRVVYIYWVPRHPR